MLTRRPQDTRSHQLHGQLADLTANERLLLSLVQRHGDVVRPTLVGGSGLAQQTVHRLTNELIERGLLRQAGAVHGQRGQPAQILRIAPDGAFAFGFVLDPDTARVGLADLNGHLLERRQLDVEPSNRVATIAAVRSEIDAIMAERKLDRRRVVGLGVGLSGYFVGDEGHINPPIPLAEWGFREIGQDIADGVGLPAWIDNASTLGAVGEALSGVCDGAGHLVYLSINYGFGGGIVLGGRPYRGSNGNAGEFSLAFDSGEGEWRPALEGLLSLLGDQDPPITSPKALRAEFNPTWPAVSEWLDRIEPQASRIVNMLTGALDPDCIVIGGEAPRQLVEMVIARIRVFGRPRFGVPMRRPRLIASVLGPDASLKGAATLPFYDLFF